MKNNWICKTSQVVRKSKSNWIQVVQYNISYNNQSLPTILNYFDKGNKNASSESFNAKAKAYRLQFRVMRKYRILPF
jgi:hypothetical protein